MRLYTAERTDPLREALEADVLLFPDVEGRKMMGCPCYMARGKMFAFLVDDAVVVTRLDRTDRERLEAEHGAGPFTHGPRVMSGWARVPMGREDLAGILPYVKRSYEAAMDEAARG
jgi:hypothetical protein